MCWRLFLQIVVLLFWWRLAGWLAFLVVAGAAWRRLAGGRGGGE